MGIIGHGWQNLISEPRIAGHDGKSHAGAADRRSWMANIIQAPRIVGHGWHLSF
jgi:hypothetical protein